jgi:hypothetical protein
MEAEVSGARDLMNSLVRLQYTDSIIALLATDSPRRLYGRPPKGHAVQGARLSSEMLETSREGSEAPCLAFTC